MLYTVNKSPIMFRNLETCLRIAPAGDPILLYEDGVYAAVAGATTDALVQEMLNQHPVYVLEADVQARGLTRLISGIEVVGYDRFVDLVVEHNVTPWM
ncbi:MAG: sulfurtransferase complex subunit TusB [Chloroflexi bacterium]|nr:sulfurtransferase complex subunit TusB [Chloroflexota bacterium]